MRNDFQFLPLEKVCEIQKGVQFNKINMKKEGTYPVINGGINPSGYIEDFNQPKDSITISQGGASAGYVNWISTDFWAGGHCYIIKPYDGVLKRYIFHFLKSQERNLQKAQYGAGIPALAKSTVANLLIPIPPLETQEKIVKILDTFTDLIFNLERELELRKKQYIYYREKLITVRCEGSGVKLGDVAKVLRGKRLVKSQLNDKGKYAVYHGGLEPLGFYSEYNREADTVMIINVGASAGTVGYSDKKFWSSDGCFCISKFPEVIEKFLYYYLKEHEKYFFSKVRVAGIPTLDRNIIEKFEIQLPPLEIQEKIAKTLDNFTALISNIEREIILRKKQYEFYREKLLNFG